MEAMEAMEATEAHLSNVVVTAVPSVTEGRAKEVAAYLVNDVGITSMERLNLIRESDFCNANLLPAEARLCLLALTPRKSEKGSITLARGLATLKFLHQ